MGTEADFPRNHHFPEGNAWEIPPEAENRNSIIIPLRKYKRKYQRHAACGGKFMQSTECCARSGKYAVGFLDLWNSGRWDIGGSVDLRGQLRRGPARGRGHVDLRGQLGEAQIGPCPMSPPPPPPHLSDVAAFPASRIVDFPMLKCPCAQILCKRLLPRYSLAPIIFFYPGQKMLHL